MTPVGFPLCWPEGVPRVKTVGPSPFKVGLERAVSDLRDALRLFGQDSGHAVSGVVISSNVSLGVKRPADPGVAVYFMWDGSMRCIAVDRFPTPEANVRAIYQIIEGRRQELRYGGLHMVRASFTGLRALPAPEDWRTVLGLAGDASLEQAEASYRARVRVAHPDQPGGSAEWFARINEAWASAQAAFGKGKRAAE